MKRQRNSQKGSSFDLLKAISHVVRDGDVEDDDDGSGGEGEASGAQKVRSEGAIGLEEISERNEDTNLQSHTATFLIR